MVLHQFRRKNYAHLCVLWLALVGMIVPPQALATPTPRAQFETVETKSGIAYVLQDEDEPEVVAAGLMAQARKLGTNTIRVHVVRGPKDDKRLLTILRALKLAKFDIQASVLDLTTAEGEIRSVSAITFSPEQLAAMVKREGRIAGETENYGDSWLAGALTIPSKAVSIGEALLGMPARLFRWSMTKLTGQKFHSLTSFVVEPAGSNPDLVTMGPQSKSWLKTSLYTAVLAVAMIWANTFLMGPYLSDSPEYNINTLGERGYHQLIHACYSIFLWVFVTLAIAGPITAWKDQVVRLKYDEKATPGAQIQVLPNPFVNFGMALLLETMLNILLPVIGGSINAFKDGTAWTVENLMKFFWAQVWVPVTALFSVFSFVVPQNLFGRWINRADVLSRSANLWERQRGSRYRLYAKAGSFVFWTFLFSTAVNLIRFIPKDRPVTYYFPEALSWMNEFLGWMPAAAAPLLAMGFIGFSWQYGSSIVKGVKSFFKGAYNFIRGRKTPESTPRYATGCAYFLVGAPQTEITTAP